MTRLRTVPRPPGAPARDDPRDWPSESTSELIERLERELAHREMELAKTRGYLAHWQGNHADVVKRLALLHQRPDLPVDRIPAYAELKRLQGELARLQEEKIQAPRNFCPACGKPTPAGSIHTCAPEAP